MIKEILDLLKDTDCKADIVQLAKGKNKFPDSFKEVFTRQKQQTEWLKAVFEINQNKRSNIQFGIGGKFYFNKHSIVNNSNENNCK